MRFRVLSKSGFACVYCGVKGELHIDHVVPIARGGTNDEENLVASCIACNQGKSDTLLVRATPSVSLLKEMLRRPFLTWLRAQRGRDDIVGDFAKDTDRMADFLEPRSYKSLCKEMRRHGLGIPREVYQAAWHAWREFRRKGEPTGPMKRWFPELISRPHEEQA